MVQVRAVDPRSTTWELDDPVFRVTFFRHDPAYADVPPEFVGYESEEWELTGGDVQEALAWATEHSGLDRTWTLHVAGPSSERPGLIWLAGTDPNAASAPTTTWRFTIPDGTEEQHPGCPFTGPVERAFPACDMDACRCSQARSKSDKHPYRGVQADHPKINLGRAQPEP